MKANPMRMTVLFLMATLLATAGLAFAQESGEPNGENAQTRERTETQQQLQECLEEGAGQRLTVQVRERLRSRINEAEDAGLPTEPLLAKVQEGLRKRASAEALEQSVETMSDNLAYASATADAALAAGASGEPGERSQAVRTMAMAMWGGLGEGDLDHLRAQTRQRLQINSCSLEELASAAETTLALRERGVDAERAINLAGEALRQGYSSSELRAMRAMTESFPGPQARVRDMIRDMETCLGEGMGSGEMIQHMVQEGWMVHGSDQDMGGHGSPDTDPGGTGGSGSGSGSGTGGSGSGSGSN